MGGGGGEVQPVQGVSNSSLPFTVEKSVEILSHFEITQTYLLTDQ